MHRDLTRMAEPTSCEHRGGDLPARNPSPSHIAFKIANDRLNYCENRLLGPTQRLPTALNRYTKSQKYLAKLALKVGVLDKGAGHQCSSWQQMCDTHRDLALWAISGERTRGPYRALKLDLQNRPRPAVGTATPMPVLLPSVAKTNELPMFSVALDQIDDLKKILVTADALHASASTRCMCAAARRALPNFGERQPARDEALCHLPTAGGTGSKRGQLGRRAAYVRPPRRLTPPGDERSRAARGICGYGSTSTATVRVLNVDEECGLGG